MIKVLTPQQLKEHNKLLEQQLLLDKENEKEEETEDYQERLDDWAERITSIWDTISTLQETIESVVRKDDINELKNIIQSISSWITKTKAEINKSIESKSNIKHTHTMAWIEWLIDELDSLQSQLDNATKTINNELKTKLDNDYKPKVEDITGLKEELNKLYEKIQSIKIPEVDLSDYYTKDKVYNKDETYNKKEVDSKIVRLWSSKSWAWYNYINDSITDEFFTRSSDKIQTQIATAVWPYITVWTAWSWATYECDWTADQEQIQQAIDTGSPFFILEWSYSISWEMLLDSWTTITGAGKWQVTLTVTWMTTWSVFRTRTAGSRIYRVEIKELRISKTYNVAHTVKAIDFSKISISRFDSIEVNWFNYWFYASGDGTYYNNFYDMTATSCDYSYYITSTVNENRFYGWRSDNAVIDALHLASTNSVHFFWLSFEWTDQSISLVSAEDCWFYGCRFEMYWTSDVNFDSATFWCMIFWWHFEWPVTFTDNGKNTILNWQFVRSDIKWTNNSDWRKYEHKGSWANTNAVHLASSSYSSSWAPAIYRAMARRFDSMLFEWIYDNGSVKNRSFGVDANTWNIFTLSPDWNAWLIWVSNAWTITITATTNFTL